MGEELDYTAVVSELRENFDRGVIISYDARLQQLNQLHKMVEENQDEIADALYKDLHKGKFESLIAEVYTTLAEARNAINNLREWMKPEKVAKDLANKSNKCEVQRDPLGVILMISPWNYPTLLAVQPIVGAFAAGNCVILKPSEVAIHSSDLWAQLIPKYLSSECIRVIQGGIPEATALLRCRFDHILYTGNAAVGKIVMKAASEHLTPVTLELGGKNPTIVDSTCDFDLVAQRIAWGKFFNNGQTCLAVDYIMCIGACQDRLLASLKKAIIKFFGENPKESTSYGRIINKRHFQRLCSYIIDHKVVYGNVKDEDDLYISPTIMTNLTDGDKVMQDEIFGPLLLIRNFGTIQDAIKYLRAREKPLALYLFSKDKNVIEMVKTQTSSGGMVVNDTLTHFAALNLPFGGVGHSGMGEYHGKYSFDTFSHKKAFLQTRQNMESLQSIRYPPYDEKSRNLQVIRWLFLPSLKRGGIDISYLFYFIFIVLVVSIAFPYFQNRFM